MNKILLFLLLIPTFGVFAADEGSHSFADLVNLVESDSFDSDETSSLEELKKFMAAYGGAAYDNLPIVEYVNSEVFFSGAGLEELADAPMAEKQYFLRIFFEIMPHDIISSIPFVSKQLLFNDNGIFLGENIAEEILLNYMNEDRWENVPIVETFLRHLLGYEYAEIVNMPMDIKSKTLYTFLKRVSDGELISVALASLKSGIDSHALELSAEQEVMKAIREKYHQHLPPVEYQKIYTTPEAAEAAQMSIIAELHEASSNFVQAAEELGLLEGIKASLGGEEVDLLEVPVSGYGHGAGAAVGLDSQEDALADYLKKVKDRYPYRYEKCKEKVDRLLKKGHKKEHVLKELFFTEPLVLDYATELYLYKLKDPFSLEYARELLMEGENSLQILAALKAREYSMFKKTEIDEIDKKVPTSVMRIINYLPLEIRELEYARFRHNVLFNNHQFKVDSSEEDFIDIIDLNIIKNYVRNVLADDFDLLDIVVKNDLWRSLANLSVDDMKKKIRSNFSVNIKGLSKGEQDNLKALFKRRIKGHDKAIEKFLSDPATNSSSAHSVLNALYDEPDFALRILARYEPGGFGAVMDLLGSVSEQ